MKQPRGMVAACPAESDPSLLPWGASTSWPGGVIPAAGENATLLPGMRLLISAAEAPATAPIRLGYIVIRENATVCDQHIDLATCCSLVCYSLPLLTSRVRSMVSVARSGDARINTSELARCDCERRASSWHRRLPNFALRSDRAIGRSPAAERSWNAATRLPQGNLCYGERRGQLARSKHRHARLDASRLATRRRRHQASRPRRRRSLAGRCTHRHCDNTLSRPSQVQRE